MSRLRQFPIKDIQRNTKIYNEYEFIGMEDGWYPKNKVQNYELMLKLPTLSGIPLLTKSVLDVGCGKGDFSPILRKNGVSSYLGLDINEIALEKARERHPKELFIFTDLLKRTFKEQFDYVFCSGALTMKLSEKDNYAFLEAMVEKMWNLSSIGVVFNVLTDEVTPMNTELFFYSPELVYSICSNIVHDNHIMIERTPGVAQIHVYLWRN